MLPVFTFLSDRFSPREPSSAMNFFCLEADILNGLCKGYDLEIPGIANILCYFLNIHAQFN